MDEQKFVFWLWNRKFWGFVIYLIENVCVLQLYMWLRYNSLWFSNNLVWGLMRKHLKSKSPTHGTKEPTSLRRNYWQYLIAKWSTSRSHCRIEISNIRSIKLLILFTILYNKLSHLITRETAFSRKERSIKPVLFHSEQVLLEACLFRSTEQLYPSIWMMHRRLSPLSM